MEQRIDYARAAPDAIRVMQALEKYIAAESDLESELLELVKLRASQINGCAYCIDMHSTDARARGEDEQRLYLLSTWREAPFYTERERAALDWTETVTQIGRAGVGDSIYQEARRHFSEKELVDLTVAVIAINGWNRLAVAFQRDVGSYRRGATAAAPAPAAETDPDVCILCGKSAAEAGAA